MEHPNPPARQWREPIVITATGTDPVRLSETDVFTETFFVAPDAGNSGSDPLVGPSETATYLPAQNGSYLNMERVDDLYNLKNWWVKPGAAEQVIRIIFPLLALLCSLTVFAATPPPPPTTAFTRTLLKAPSAEAARTVLNVAGVGTNLTHNTSQFDTTGDNVSIKSGATLSNTPIYGLRLPGADASVGYVWKCTNSTTGQGHWAEDTGGAGGGITQSEADARYLPIDGTIEELNVNTLNASNIVGVVATVTNIPYASDATLYCGGDIRASVWPTLNGGNLNLLLTNVAVGATFSISVKADGSDRTVSLFAAESLVFATTNATLNLTNLSVKANKVAWITGMWTRTNELSIITACQP